MSCLQILEFNLLSVASFEDIFFHSEGCPFISFMDSFAMQKLLHLIRSHLFIFLFIFITLRGVSKKILLWFMSVFCLCFPLSVLYFWALHLGLWSVLTLLMCKTLGHYYFFFFCPGSLNVIVTMLPFLYKWISICNQIFWDFFLNLSFISFKYLPKWCSVLFLLFWVIIIFIPYIQSHSWPNSCLLCISLHTLSH